MIRNTITLTLALLIFALAASSGCKSSAHVPAGSPGSPQMYFATEELRRDTVVDPPIVDRDENNLLRVTIPIRSALNYTLYVDYRVTWLDRNGQPLTEHTGWLTKTLEANTPDRVTVTSTS